MPQNAVSGGTAHDIAASVEQALARGEWRDGDSLPAIRRLAADLHVSPVTVAAAYRLLRSRGFVIGQGRRGTRVRSGVAQIAGARIARQTPPLHDLASGNPDPELLPAISPLLRTLDYAPPRYGEDPVFRPLATFARGELSADGVAADALFVASGTLDAVERLLQAHARPGDRVAVEDPTLPAVIELVESCGLAVEPLEIDAEGPTAASVDRALRRRIGAMLITSRAQNPTGAAMTRERAAALKGLLRRRRDVLVIESDPAGPVAGAPLASLCDRSHPLWAVIRSTSKFLGPDLRVAIVAGDPLTIGRARRRQSLGARWVSHLLQHLAYVAWSDPASARRLVRAGEIYALRRTRLLAALAAKGIRVQAASGFNVWLPVRAETAVVQALASRGWAVAAGEGFRLRTGPGVRVTTATLSSADAQTFAADFEDAARGFDVVPA
jgi:DNA-binding transcriptional MocR family regulator